MIHVLRKTIFLINLIILLLIIILMFLRPESAVNMINWFYILFVVGVIAGVIEYRVK